MQNTILKWRSYSREEVVDYKNLESGDNGAYIFEKKEYFEVGTYNTVKEAKLQVLALELYNVLGEAEMPYRECVKGKDGKAFVISCKVSRTSRDPQLFNLDCKEDNNKDFVASKDYQWVSLIDFIMGNAEPFILKDAAKDAQSNYDRWKFDSAFNFSAAVSQKIKELAGDTISSEIQDSFAWRLLTSESKIAEIIERYAPEEEQLNLFLNIMTRRHQLLMAINQEYCTKVSEASNRLHTSQAQYFEKMKAWWTTAFLGKLYYEADITNVTVDYITEPDKLKDGEYYMIVNNTCYNKTSETHIPTFVSADVHSKYGFSEPTYKVFEDDQSSIIYFDASCMERVRRIITQETGVDPSSKKFISQDYANRVLAELNNKRDANSMLAKLISLDFYCGIGKTIWNYTLGGIISYISSMIGSMIIGSTEVKVEKWAETSVDSQLLYADLEERGGLKFILLA